MPFLYFDHHSMRVISVNVNGIRAAQRKGFFNWLRAQKADYVCLQELKAQEDQIADKAFWPPSFHCFYHPAERKGYSGVGIYCRQKPEQIIKGIGWPDFDAEGRWIEARSGNFSVISLYLPSGSSGEERQQIKYGVLDRLLPYLETLKAEGRQAIICGDWNIAHKNIDLKNWRGNQKNSGFLPEERAWMDKLFDGLGYIDGFREYNQEEDQYTWWSNRGQARANNVGWRIDYQVLTPNFAGKTRHTAVYKKKWFSDHAPLTIDYDLD